MIVGIVVLAICGTACLHLLLPAEDDIELDWSDVELPPKPKRDRAAERAERAAAAEAEGGGGGGGGGGRSKRSSKGGYAEYDGAGYCRSRQPPNNFHGRFWKRLETDPRDAPLHIRAVNNVQSGATGGGAPSSAAAVNAAPGAPTSGAHPGSSSDARANPAEAGAAPSTSTPLLLTASALRELPRERGGLLMRLLLEGDVPEGVTPRLVIPEEYVGLVSETESDGAQTGNVGAGAAARLRQEHVWSFPSCAVVGHSGVLKGGGLGKEIDRHRAVFRLDMAPTSGFEADVGGKTTFDVSAAAELRRLLPPEELRGREEEDDVEEEEEEAAPSSKQQRRAKRNKAGAVADLAAAKGRGSRLVLHELFNRAALRGTYPPLLRAWGGGRRGSALLAPALVIHILQVWDRLTGAMDAAASGGADDDDRDGKKGAEKASGVPPGAFKGAPRASSAAVATLLALQLCDQVHLYGLAPPLAVTGRPSDGRTKAAYRFYFDRGVAHVGTLKKHAFDPAYEAFKALAAWPCSGVTLALHDPKPAAPQA